MAYYFEKLRSLAGDYSGAAAVLYDLNGMLIFCDASACMGGFLFAEDPIGGNDELRGRRERRRSGGGEDRGRPGPP